MPHFSIHSISSQMNKESEGMLQKARQSTSDNDQRNCPRPNDLSSFARRAIADSAPFFSIPKDPSNDEELPTDRVCYGGPQKEQLEFNVNRMVWNQKGGKQILRVTNRTPIRMAYKIKCSDNNIFRVNPVFGTVNTEEVAEIEIYRKAAAPIKEDIVVFCSVKYTPEENNLEAFFKKPTTITNEKCIYQTVEPDNATNSKTSKTLLKC
ncbi:MSP domain protein [Dictyocaulus viviparus]|uniref:Major sperm protein n=1 Tax=Dictyocaulus viviparus TaxID=29172 RepID=A0A0D8Y1N1_DICVI|nr:MSP domain protein [Dictyocaulus viviparus]